MVLSDDAVCLSSVGASVVLGKGPDPVSGTIAGQRLVRLVVAMGVDRL